jgi:iron complex outermembrane receptor protein
MKTVFTFLAMLGLATQTFAQKQNLDSTTQNPIALDEVLVRAIRAKVESPVTFSNLNRQQLENRNLGQDIPVLMNFLPAVVTTSDAGAGVGYTGIRVRGSDATRVNVTINGVPYNDSESHGTFWVNMPDFASSTESLQLQRGVGSSTNGAGAFGASLNLLTESMSESAFAAVSGSAGSFGTHKATLRFGTGLLSNHFEISGRLSRIGSDGYIDRAASDLRSYFLQASYRSDKSLLKALVFGGHEITYQSWYGYDASIMAAIGLDNSMRENRQFNVAGIRFDDSGNFEGFYDNQVDNYKQNHVQLHWNQDWTPAFSSHLALHYTKGSGYYEEYVDDWYYSNVFYAPDAQLAFLGLNPILVNGVEISSMDYIRQRWLDNDFYGAIYASEYCSGPLELTIGGGWNYYLGDHFGELVWARYAGLLEKGNRYYQDDSRKNDFNTFAKINFEPTTGWKLFADLQYRGVRYQANGNETGVVNDRFRFFNPKIGITHAIHPNQKLYLTYAIANREPNRNDYESGNPKPEHLQDLELGWRYSFGNTLLNANVYYMRYRDQLVLTGALNDVGAPLRANVGDSFRMGLELDAYMQLGKQWVWQPNLAWSQNQNVDFFFRRNGTLQALGNTQIAFSPSLVAGSRLVYQPTNQWQLGLLNKYVGEQFMSNIEAEDSRLGAYFQTDLNLSYTLISSTDFPEVTITALINNIFDARYSSNGYYYTYDDYYSIPGEIITQSGAGYYPQAGINLLTGIQLRF